MPSSCPNSTFISWIADVRSLSAAILILSITFLSSCSLENKDQALGENDVVSIIADSADYSELEDVIENSLSRPFFTPQPERWFRLSRYDLADLLDHKRERNILIMAPIDAGNAMGEYMRTALDSNVQKLVRSGEQHVFVKKDLWYRGQVVVHVTGSSMEDMRNFLASNGDQLEYYFLEAWRERERKTMLNLPREEELEEHLFDRYGWSVAAIKSWFVGKDSSELGTVLLRRQAPRETERWLMVHWIDTTNTSLLNPKFAYETRNRLTKILYRTYDDSAWVVIDSVNNLQFDEVNFQGRYAVRMKGLWRMSDHSMGGPFLSYLLYDEDQRRIYFLDGSIFAPRYEKRKLIQDIDVMMHTLRLKKNTPSSDS